MQEIQVGKVKTLTVPATVDTITVTHEWGDTIVSAASVTAGGSYSFTPTSIGVHKFVWKAGATIVKTEYFSSAVLLSTDSDFFNDYPDLETAHGDEYLLLERRARHVIEAYCGQKFGPFQSLTLEVQGEGGDSLELPYRITSLNAVEDNWGEDLSDLVEIPAGSEWFIGFKSSFRYFADVKRDITRNRHDFFTERLSFVVEGDFGWPYVPTEVAEASKLLIADAMIGANDLRQHGVNEAQLGDFSYKLNADQWGTTGNTQADLMLTPFVIMRIGLV